MHVALITRFLGLCLTISCLVICYTGLKAYLAYEKGTLLTRVRIKSEDVPAFAICPQPALNRVAFESLEEFHSESIRDSFACPESGCKFMDEFGLIIEENNMTSEEIIKFYREIKFGAHEVVGKVIVTLINGTEVEVDLRTSSLYQLPIYEMVDCPVVMIPSGLEEPAKIT